MTYDTKVGSGRTDYLANIDNIKVYETRLDELNENVSWRKEHEGESEIEIEVYYTAEDNSEPLPNDAIIELGREKMIRREPQRLSDYTI